MLGFYARALGPDAGVLVSGAGFLGPEQLIASRALASHGIPLGFKFAPRPSDFFLRGFERLLVAARACFLSRLLRFFQLGVPGAYA